MFSAVLIEKGETGQTVGVTELDEAQLPDFSDDTVSIDVEYCTLNYKDDLAITGKSPVVRKFPMVPGIDLAGVVTESSHADWSKGDRVVLNGWGVGETHWGGLAQRARLNGDWLIPLSCVVPHDDVILDAEQLLAFLRQRLASYKVPRHVLFFGEDEVAVTGNAKIKAGALRELAAKRLAGN